MDKIKELILSIAEQALHELNTHGFMLGGHNGPYYDPETPVRNTSHWITIYAYCFDVSQDARFSEAVKTCSTYLLSPEARPMDKTFFCRTNPKKDFSNGTIGQAWAIEGLVRAYQLLKDERLLDVAETVFLQHPFDDKCQLWQVVNVDGSYRDFDKTYNHQLWFAASGYLIHSQRPNDEIIRQCSGFMDTHNRYFKIYGNGLIKHGIEVARNRKDKVFNLLDKINLRLRKLRTGKSMQYKENGYHLFNVYAFAFIKSLGFNLSIFNTAKFKKALNYCYSEELKYWFEDSPISKDMNKMEKVIHTKVNIYGYPYNAPGFELPFIDSIFTRRSSSCFSSDACLQLEKQLEYTFNVEDQTFSKGGEDTFTLNARLYELIRAYDLLANKAI